jgi:hypothetical protein
MAERERHQKKYCREMVEKWLREKERHIVNGSKLSQASFCETNGISESTFSMWKFYYHTGRYLNQENDEKFTVFNYDPVAQLNAEMAEKFPWLADDIEIRVETSVRGFGLFAKRDLKARFCLGYYEGEVIQSNDVGINTFAYEVGNGNSIDASHRLACYARYCNDSVDDEAVNALAVPTHHYSSDQKNNIMKSIMYITVKDIPAGTA